MSLRPTGEVEDDGARRPSTVSVGCTLSRRARYEGVETDREVVSQKVTKFNFMSIPNVIKSSFQIAVESRKYLISSYVMYHGLVSLLYFIKCEFDMTTSVSSHFTVLGLVAVKKI